MLKFVWIAKVCRTAKDHTYDIHSWGRYFVKISTCEIKYSNGNNYNISELNLAWGEGVSPAAPKPMPMWNDGDNKQHAIAVLLYSTVVHITN